MAILNILRNLLQQIINDIDTGNSNISETEQHELLDLIERIMSEDVSKLEAAHNLGVSRATFDNYVKDGKLPKGRKRFGFKELSWRKFDLNKFKNVGNNKQ